MGAALQLPDRPAPRLAAAWDVFRPAPRLSLSKWADRYGYLSSGERWDTSVVPYLREIMDATTDRSVREIVVEKAARLGYTEGVLGQRVAYDLHQDPERVLVVFPLEGDGKDWSQKQLAKMIEASPALSPIMPVARGREAGNTILNKIYPGGSITIRGAHSPKGLRRHTARDVLLDEVDGMRFKSGDEGDPVMLATRANRTLPDRKTLMGSTPGLALNSRIRAALRDSDWREYHVPCPHCREYQVLEWGGPDSAHGIKWAKQTCCRSCGVELEEDGPCSCGSEERASTHLPDTAHYVCRFCFAAIEESEKPAMLAAGRWVPRYPGRSVRGYKISGLLSPFEGASWARIVEVFLRSKGDPALLQVWVNQWLGDPFENAGARVDPRGLESRAAQFVGAGGELVEVPDGVGVLCAGVDVHPDRLELLVQGYGVAWETWDILHERIYGPVQSTETWSRLSHLLTRAYRHQSGAELHLLNTFIDSADGNTVEFVYRYLRGLGRRNVWAARGDMGRADATFSIKPNRVHGSQLHVWPIATFPAKASLFYRMGQTLRDEGVPAGPGRLHCRVQTPQLCNGFDSEYFAQFAAEEKRRVRVKGTAKYEERFVQIRDRNEAIDLHVLADSAFRALNLRDEQMGEFVEAVRKRKGPAPARPRVRVLNRGIS